MRIFLNEETLEACGIQLGFRTDKITGHGHVMILRTILPIKEYYPGGEVSACVPLRLQFAIQISLIFHVFASTMFHVGNVAKVTVLAASSWRVCP
jgi:hypothetical protein